MAGDIIDPKKYFSAIVAGLLILGIAIGAAVWAFMTYNAEERAEKTLQIEETAPAFGAPTIPTTAPSVPFPTTPPPGN